MKIAINGFGRIGRLTFRRLIDNKNAQIVAINDLTDVKTLAHLLKYDSVHGKFDGEVSVVDGNIVVNGNTINVSAERNPGDLPWADLAIEVVVESTGVFTHSDKAHSHLEAGAKKVVIRAPAKGDLKTVVLGVNDDSLNYP